MSHDAGRSHLHAALPSRTTYRAIKRYGHNEGLSCAFRQWRATHSHCRLLHGYALAFSFVFAAHELDERMWCFDFGGLKPVRAWLHETFDHTTLIAADDPYLTVFEELDMRGLISLRVLPAVGCEAVARHVFDHVGRFVRESSNDRVWLESVEVGEHSGNAARYTAAAPGAEVAAIHLQQPEGVSL
jgi:6-pyruvoyltetrahydropterin/6-carboxytetrahydropterin synthase